MSSLPDSLLAAWFFAFGAIVGSFLNVVIYRLPAQKSIVRPGSHCPTCGHAIRWYDNIPVLSWILLRGRCRDCRTPISMRYPLVEFVTGLMFLLVAWYEVLGGLAGTVASEAAALRVPTGNGQLLGLSAYHLLLLSTLLAAGLIEYDGKPVPRGLLLPAMIAGLAAPLVWPWLRPLPAWRGLDTGPWAALIDGIAGLTAGGLAGIPAAILSRGREGGRWQILSVTGLLGLVLGWQPGLLIAAAGTLAFAALQAVPRLMPGLRRVSLLCLFLATLAWILVWPSLGPQLHLP